MSLLLIAFLFLLIFLFKKVFNSHQYCFTRFYVYILFYSFTCRIVMSRRIIDASLNSVFLILFNFYGFACIALSYVCVCVCVCVIFDSEYLKKKKKEMKNRHSKMVKLMMKELPFDADEMIALYHQLLHENVHPFTCCVFMRIQKDEHRNKKRSKL